MGRFCQTDCQRGDVGRRRRAAVPAVRAACESLSCESGLAEAGRRDEHEDSGFALVEDPRQPRPLDDAYPLDLPEVPLVCHFESGCRLPAVTTVTRFRPGLEIHGACGQQLDHRHRSVISLRD